MGIVNMAHAASTRSAPTSHLVGGRGGGHACAGRAVIFLLLGAIAVALIGLAIEPTLIRPFYRRPEAYQLLVTSACCWFSRMSSGCCGAGAPFTASDSWTPSGSFASGTPYPVYNL